MTYLHTLLIPALILGLVTLSGCNRDDHAHDEMSPEELDQHVLDIHTDEEGNIVYTCSMHPEVRLNEPGNCPICGMDLVMVSAEQETPAAGTDAMDSSPQMDMDMNNSQDESSSEQDNQTETTQSAIIPITPVQQQLIGMQLDTVKSRSLNKEIRTIGRLTHAEPNLTEIVTRTSGYVEEAHVTETGVHVHQGEELVTVYSPGLVSAQEDYLVARRSSNSRLAAQARERLRLLNMPESEIERLEAAGEALQEVTLLAPKMGHIMVNNVRQGMQFEAGTMLYRLNDHSRLWLQADIYEEDLPFIHIGQNVTFDIQGRPGENFEGTISFLPPAMNSATRTTQARIEVPNPDFTLRMDQYARVSFNNDLGEVLSVHRDAVLMTGRRAVVFRETGPGRFEPVEVQLGPLAGEYYVLLEGLSENDRVVTSGRFWLDAESRLRGAGAMAGHDH